MDTNHLPKSHIQLGYARDGLPYGHMPGRRYSDVDVLISRRGQNFRVEICASHGAAQGHDEEHGRTTVIGRGQTLEAACVMASRLAQDTKMNEQFLHTALSQAIDEATETMILSESAF